MPEGHLRGAGPGSSEHVAPHRLPPHGRQLDPGSVGTRVAGALRFALLALPTAAVHASFSSRLPSSFYMCAGKEDGIGILNVTAEICGTADHVRGNGLPGGWVAPKPKIGRRRRLEEQHLPADGHDT